MAKEVTEKLLEGPCALCSLCARNGRHFVRVMHTPRRCLLCGKRKGRTVMVYRALSILGLDKGLVALIVEHRILHPHYPWLSLPREQVAIMAGPHE